jgi:hypothetical protein
MHFLTSCTVRHGNLDAALDCRNASVNTNALHTPYDKVLGYRIDRWDSTLGRARISISDATAGKFWDRPNESFLGKTSQL